MASEFLGKAWKYPVQMDTQGRIGRAPYEEAIRQSIWIILGTARGERKMRPDFGCGIHDLVFAVNSTTTHGTVAYEVQRALILWEPRIDVVDVTVLPDPRQPTLLLIRIAYRVRATNSEFNLVYPFYLHRSAT